MKTFEAITNTMAALLALFCFGLGVLIQLGADGLRWAGVKLEEAAHWLAENPDRA